MPEENESSVQKTHRERKSGRKADKKKYKNIHTQELTDKQRNPKAFAFNSVVRAERKFRRTEDIQSKKHHIPLVDRTPIEPPPVIVAIVGPPKVGKSTLMQCLIKNFVKQRIANIQGPVTIVIGKKRRLTLIECNNDINSMIDIAKVADLVLLLIDASFGFEMEIFEFLNICQVHGMPRIMGVLTHLDLIKNSEKLKKIKKTLKHRFWTEVYAGAKLFYLSGQLHNEYLKNEVKNLARFISVIKFRPITWRSTHPYILADRFEDLTQNELMRQNPKINRTISLYGYVRGVSINKSNRIHVPGCGDLIIEEILSIPDPCPLPDKIKKRSLIGQERLIYAPFSGVGGIVYDKDAVYVELGNSYSHHYMKEGSELITNILKSHEPVEKKIEHSEIQLYSNCDPKEIESHSQKLIHQDGRTRRKVIFKESDEEVEKHLEEDFEEEEEDSNSNFDKNEANSIENDSEEEDESEDLPIPKKQKISSETDISIKENALNKTPKNVEKSYETLEKELNYLIGLSDVGENEIHCEENVLQNNPHFSDDIKSSKYHKINKEDLEVKQQISDALSKLNNSKNIQYDTDSDTSNDEDDLSENDQIYNEDHSSNSEENIDGNPDENDSCQEDDFDLTTESSVKWKDNLAQKASDAFLERQSNSHNLWKLVYENDLHKEKRNNSKNNENLEEDDDIGGLFQLANDRQKNKLQERDDQNQNECSRFSVSHVRNWEDHLVRLMISDCFVTGKWKDSEDARELLKLDDLEDDDEMLGDFEDLETGEKHEAQETEETKKPLTKKELIEKKKKLKEKFDAEYDENEGEGGKTHYDDLKEEMNAQAQLNKSEFEGLDENIRQQLEGFRPGLYVRIQVSNVPCELVENFDPNYPLIIGGLNSGEENIGYVQVRMKKHRWYPKILKSRDPLIVSLGWRRFQTLPLYAKLEDNLKHRFLKYTPPHLACIAHMWGPITIQGSGMLAFQNLSSQQQMFRIAATGSVIELDQSTQIMKKLKLTGAPLAIYHKTAFIEGMFNSSLEVAKFEGAKIKTVSGIRGQIKKGINKIEGAFRATFEDKIKLSDIVFCRTWYKVDIPQLYNPVTSLLLPKEQKSQWYGMKTLGELKHEHNLKIEANTDNLYTDIERKPQVFKPLNIPRSLQRELPYKDKPKPNKKSIKNLIENKNRRKIAVIKEPKEERVSKMVRMLKTSYQNKREKTKMDMHKRMTEHQKNIHKEELKKLKRQKELRKQIFRTLSKMDMKNSKKMR